MGREIRRVPPNWQHPKYTEDTAKYREQVGQFIPLFEGYEKALADFAKLINKKGLGPAIDEEGGGPLSESYVQYGKARPTWYQVYETVSEGTPVSPPFATKDELVEYLVKHGDSWGRREGSGGWRREVAVKFVEVEWCPSGVIDHGVFKTGPESLL